MFRDKNVNLSLEDVEYYTQVYSDYYKLMYSVAWKYADDCNMVEDIVSDSNLALMRRIDVLRRIDPGKLQAYISTTVKNMAVNYHRKKKTARKRLAVYELAEQVEATDTDLLLQIEIKEEYQSLLQSMHSLTRKERSILHMHFFMQLSTREIANMVGLSPSSIRTYICRSRQRIRNYLNEEAQKGMKNDQQP